MAPDNSLDEIIFQFGIGSVFRQSTRGIYTVVDFGWINIRHFHNRIDTLHIVILHRLVDPNLCIVCRNS